MITASEREYMYIYIYIRSYFVGFTRRKITYWATMYVYKHICGFFSSSGFAQFLLLSFSLMRLELQNTTDKYIGIRISSKRNTRSTLNIHVIIPALSLKSTPLYSSSIIFFFSYFLFIKISTFYLGMK